jgi:hypothetical protein
MLAPGGSLAILWADAEPPPWSEALARLIGRFIGAQGQAGGESAAPARPPFTRPYGAPPNFDQAAELGRRGLFREVGRTTTAPVAYCQSLEQYVESFHSSVALSRERLGPERMAAFDAAARELISRHSGGAVELRSFAEIVWGKPGR